MNPTKQTVLHDPANGKHGNCFSAVLASLLHLPIEDVPVFSSPAPKWQQELNAWLRPFGLAYMQIGTFDEWCADLNISGCYCEVGGKTNRHADVSHACVGRDGMPILDPHPDDTGLTEVEASGVFIVLEPWRLLTHNVESEGRAACGESLSTGGLGVAAPPAPTFGKD